MHVNTCLLKTNNKARTPFPDSAAWDKPSKPAQPPRCLKCHQNVSCHRPSFPQELDWIARRINPDLADPAVNVEPAPLRQDGGAHLIFREMDERWNSKGGGGVLLVRPARPRTSVPQLWKKYRTLVRIWAGWRGEHMKFQSGKVDRNQLGFGD